MNDDRSGLREPALHSGELVALSLLTLVVAIRALFGVLELDESLTYWVIRDGFSSLIMRAYLFQGQSPLFYSIVVIARQLFGNAEVVLRLPSLLAWIVSAVVAYRLARSLWGEDAGRLALILFMACAHDLFAFRARPYSFAMSSMLLSTASLFGWLKTGRAALLSLFVLFSVITFYAHYLFAGIALVHALCFWQARRSISYRQLIYNFAMGIALCVPGLVQFSALTGRTLSWSFAPKPDLADLLAAWLHPLAIALPILALVITRLVTRELPRTAGAPLAQRAVMLFWFLFPPLLFFLISVLTGGALMVDRYYVWSLPGAIFLTASIAPLYSDPRARRLFARLIALGGLAFATGRQLARDPESWGDAAALVRQHATAGSSELFVVSGLVESLDPAYFLHPEARAYLAAPFSYYDTGARALWPLPMFPDEPKHQPYLSQLLDTRLADVEEAGLVVSIFQQPLSHDLDRRYRALLESRGFEQTYEEKLARAYVRTFRRVRRGIESAEAPDQPPRAHWSAISAR